MEKWNKLNEKEFNIDNDSQILGLYQKGDMYMLFEKIHDGYSVWQTEDLHDETEGNSCFALTLDELIDEYLLPMELVKELKGELS